MAVTAQAAGAWAASNATTQTVTLAAHAAGDLLLVIAACKPYTADPVINTAGWTRLYSYANGTTANGSGTGSVRQAVFYKEAASASETNPVITWNTTSAPGIAVAHTWRKGAAEVWATPLYVNGNTNSATAISVALTPPVLLAGDVCLVIHTTRDDSALTVPTWTRTSATLGTVAEFPTTAIASATSNQMAGDCAYRSVTAVGSGNVTLTGTQAAAETGVTSFVVLRAATPTLTNVAEVSLAGATDPGVDTGHVINVRARVTSGAGTAVIRAALYEGANNRSGDLSSTPLTTSLADYALAIPSASVANITSYADLSIRFWGYNPAGAALSFAVDAVALQTPTAGVVEALAGTIAAASTVAGTLAATVPLSGTIAAASTVVGGTLQAAVPLSGAIAATTTVVGILRAVVPLGGAIGATSVVGPSAIIIGVPLSGVVAAASTVVGGSLAAVVVLSGTMAATSALAGGTMQAAVPLAGTIAAASTVVGIVRATVPLAGVLASASTVTGTARATVPLSGALASVSTATVALSKARPLAAVMAVVALVAGSLTVTPSGTSVAEVSLAAATDPGVNTGHAIGIRARVTSGAGTAVMRAALYEGATNRSGDLSTDPLTTTLADYSLPISEGAATAITSYANLSIRFWGHDPAGATLTFEVDAVSLELGVPVASALSGVVAVTSTVTGALAAAVPLAGSVAATSAVAPAAVVAGVALAGTVAAASTLGAGATAGVPLAGVIAGASAGVAGLTVGAPEMRLLYWDGDSWEVGALKWWDGSTWRSATEPAGGTVALAGLIEAATALSGAALVARRLGGVVPAVADLGAALEWAAPIVNIGGTIDSASALVGQVVTKRALSGAVAAVAGFGANVTGLSPTVLSVVPSNITQTGFTLTWALDEVATGRIEYGTTPAFGSLSPKETSFDYSTHIQTLSGLTPGTTYYYRVIGEDAEGNAYASATASVATLGAPTGITYTDVTLPTSWTHLGTTYAIDHTGVVDSTPGINFWVADQAGGADATHHKRLIFPPTSILKMNTALCVASKSHVTLWGHAATSSAWIRGDSTPYQNVGCRIVPAWATLNPHHSAFIVGSRYNGFENISFSVGGTDDIVIRGFDIRGNHPNPGVYPGGGFENCNVLEYNAATNVEFCYNLARGMGGDLVRFRSGTTGHVHHNYCLNTGRMGCTAVINNTLNVALRSDHIFEYNTIDRCGYWGIDVEPEDEPNAAKMKFDGIVIRYNRWGCFAGPSVGGGFCVIGGTAAPGPTRHMADIEVYGNVIDGTGFGSYSGNRRDMYMLVAHLTNLSGTPVGQDPRPQRITIRDNAVIHGASQSQVPLTARYTDTFVITNNDANYTGGDWTALTGCTSVTEGGNT